MHLQLTLNRDAYPTNRSGFSLGNYQYNPGNMVGALGSYSNAFAANLSIRCDSPKDIRSWTVEANGVNSISAEYHNTYSTFAITNIPLGATCTWAKVTLDGQAAVSDDGQGNSQWGMHQPATNQELHFAVTPASQMAAGVFPVNPVTNITYTYDAAGQLTSRTGTNTVSYAYDAARNLTRCWSGTTFTNFYHYDHARRLICQVTLKNGTISSNRFIYEGMDVIAKVDEISGEVVYFTRGLSIAPGVGDVLAETHILGGSTATYIYVQNHRGDTIALVSNSTVVARYEYSAWGQIISNSGVSAFFTFSGKHFDADASLYYYGYRWYDPQAKRWTQPDPSGLSEGLDLYQFCCNNPVNAVDTYGSITIFFSGFGENYCPGHEACKTACKDISSDVMLFSWVGDMDKALQAIKDARNANPCEQISVFGHSYGGDTARLFCLLLGTLGYDVDELITFDAVGYLSDRTKPDNVRTWYNVYQPGSWVDSTVNAVPLIGHTIGLGSLLVQVFRTQADFNNAIAALGGHWGPQETADHNIKVLLEHNDPEGMWAAYIVYREKVLVDILRREQEIMNAIPRP